MRKIALLFLTAISILGWSCTDSSGQYNIMAPENKYILCRGSELYLNNGKKWMANFETTKGINEMLYSVDHFSQPADTSMYHALADSLMQDYIYVIQYCSNMGQAHELIHSYLFPLHDIIVPMQLGGDITCAAQYIKVKEHLQKYHEYFE